MKLENAITRLESDIKAVESGLKSPLSEVVSFIKAHKKLIITASVVYLAYRYLFAEEE